MMMTCVEANADMYAHIQVIAWCWRLTCTHALVDRSKAQILTCTYMSIDVLVDKCRHVRTLGCTEDRLVNVHSHTGCRCTHMMTGWNRCWHVCTHSGYCRHGIVLTIDMYTCISWRVEGTNADMYVHVHRCFCGDANKTETVVNVHRHKACLCTHKMFTWIEADADMYVHVHVKGDSFTLLSRAWVDDWHVHMQESKAM